MTKAELKKAGYGGLINPLVGCACTIKQYQACKKICGHKAKTAHLCIPSYRVGDVLIPSIDENGNKMTREEAIKWSKS